MPDDIPRISLSPEVNDLVRQAEQALDEQYRKSDIVGDEVAGMFRAMSLMLKAQHRLFVDGSLTTNAAIDRLKMPVIDDGALYRAVNRGIEAHATSAIYALNLRNIIYAVAGIVAAIAVAAGGGYWSGRVSAQTELLEVSPLPPLPAGDLARWLHIIALNKNVSSYACEMRPQTSGEACALVIWTKPPTPGGK